MFSKIQRKAYRDNAKVAVFSHISFSLWAVIFSDLVVTFIMGFYSMTALENNINIYSTDVGIAAKTMLISFLADLVNFPLAFCAMRAYLVLSRSSPMEQIPFRSIFEPFNSIGFLLKGTVVMLIHSLFATLGVTLILLPIYYMYSMAVFVFIDDPSVSPIKAFTQSRRLMSGKKWGTFLTVLPLILLSTVISIMLAGLPLLATVVTSVIRAIECVAFAVIYNDLKLRKMQENA